MKPSIFWKLMVLIDQASQYDTKSSLHNNLTTVNNFGSSFTLRRELNSETIRAKRTVVVLKKTRDENYCYFIDFDMGNPPQHIAAELSLQYRGLYIAAEGRLGDSTLDHVLSIWRSKPRDGIFDPSRSNGYKLISQIFYIRSGHYGSSKAAYAEDDIYVGTSVLEKGKVMVIQNEQEPALIGLGSRKSMSKYLSKNTTEEETTNFFNQLKQRGWTMKATFSIWIGSESSEMSGMILFNSINMQYARSDMYLFPLLYVKGRTGYHIKLDAINTVSSDGTITELVKLSVPVELDFTMVLSTFPSDIVELFYKDYNTTLGKPYKVDCESEYKRGSIALVFSGVQFVFPYKDILPNCQKGEPQAYSPFYPGKTFILGTNFLSTLYMVFDIDKNEVGLAIADTGVQTPMVGMEPLSHEIPGKKAPSYSKSSFNNVYSILTAYNSNSVRVITVLRDETSSTVI